MERRLPAAAAVEAVAAQFTAPPYPAQEDCFPQWALPPPLPGVCVCVSVSVCACVCMCVCMCVCVCVIHCATTLTAG